MNCFTRIITCGFFLLSCALPAIPNQKACPIPPPSPYKHNALIATTYDTVADRMRTSLQHPYTLDAANQAGGLYLYATFLHEASPLLAPAVDIVLLSVSAAPLYKRAHGLTIFADGKPCSRLGQVTYKAAPDETGALVEAIRIRLPYESLQGVIVAKNVTARLGSTEVTFTENHLEALRELASLTGRSPLKWRELGKG